MSDRAFKAAGAAQRGDGAETNARAAKARQSAWLLAAVAISVYLGYIAWMAIRAAGG